LPYHPPMAGIVASETRHARTADGVDLAYRVAGDGPVDLLWSFSQLSDVEATWDYPPIADFLRELAASARLIVHDRRGMGRSTGERGDLATDVSDLAAVLQAADARRPYLIGAVIGGGIYAAFASTRPDRVSGLVWHGAFGRSAWAPDYPWGVSQDDLDEYGRALAEGWASEEFAAAFVASGAPSRAGDVASAQFFARWMRCTSDATSAAAYNRQWDAMDLRPLLRRVRVPTLILSRGADPDEAAHVAGLIPGARFVALAGSDFMPFFDSGPILNAIRAFVRTDPSADG